MARFHVHVQVISKGQSKDGSAGFAQYIAREATDTAAQYQRYQGRQGYVSKDLVTKGVFALPAWAKNGTHFWEMADQYEGKNRSVARCYEVALPRELSNDARLELAADMRSTFFEQYPGTWAIHNPIDRHGQENPHMHLMFSERRQIDTVNRTAQEYFRRSDASPPGVAKDRSWLGHSRLHEIRAGLATLINAALEREGHVAAVTHRSHIANGITREASTYPKFGDKAIIAATKASRSQLQQDAYPAETEIYRKQWQAQKAKQGMTNLSREAIVDHVRDRFWVRDTSPLREQERQASLARRIEREHARTGQPMQGPRAPERAPLPLTAMLALLAQTSRLIDQDMTGGTLRVQINRDHEQRQGIGWS